MFIWCDKRSLYPVNSLYIYAQIIESLNNILLSEYRLFSPSG